MRALVLLSMLVLLLPVAHAQEGIHRCMGANGVPVFTDRVCSDVNATPVVPAPTSNAPAPDKSLQPPAVLCAADLKQLKQAVIDAFAERNPNRLAGVALWNGDGEAAVVTDIEFFRRLMSHPLLLVKAVLIPSANAKDPGVSQLSLSVSSQPTAGQEEMLIVQTAPDDGSGTPEETRFGIVHRSGCLWLQP